MKINLKETFQNTRQSGYFLFQIHSRYKYCDFHCAKKKIIIKQEIIKLEQPWKYIKDV